MTANSVVNRARPDVLAMKAYSSARSLHKSGPETIFLDANECPFPAFIGAGAYERYPDQQPPKLMDALCRLYDVSSRNIMTGRGADEAIDLLVRAFCDPGKDNILVCPPAFSMYGHSAILQGAEIKKAPLKTEDFSLDTDLIFKTADGNTKIVFLCSPNNPTGNALDRNDILKVCEHFKDTAVVVVDEAYIEFSAQESLIPEVENHANLVVLRTLSKGWAATGIRCGSAIAHADIIALLLKVLPPYPVPEPVVEAALSILDPKNKARIEEKRNELVENRNILIKEMETLPDVEKIFPTDCNFILVRFKDADAVMQKGLGENIILRNQSHQPGLENCLRISVGAREENEALIRVLRGESRNLKSAPQRTATITRKTKETAIRAAVNLDTEKPVRIDTGIGFYDHMLEQIAKHGGFSLELECAGDLHIDPHHSIEDCAIALGQALKEALGDKRGIGRFGFTLPLDEALASVAIDLSGRFYLDFDADFPESMVGDLPTDMVEHVFRSLAENLQANVHIKADGDNTHHIVEACFKAFGRALRQAIRYEGGEETPSTKGVL